VVAAAQNTPGHFERNHLTNPLFYIICDNDDIIHLFRASMVNRGNEKGCEAMQRINRYLAGLVVVLGLVSLAIGVGFIVEGQAKLNMMKEVSRQEAITLGIPVVELAKGNVIDTAAEAHLPATRSVSTVEASPRPTPSCWEAVGLIRQTHST
jgi:hypothetical protein